MKLELEFATGDDLINFMASLTSTGRNLIGVTDKAATAAARQVNNPSATVTPEKQEAARKSTSKTDKPPAENPATPLDALKAAVEAEKPALTYEGDVGPLFARAVTHNKPAAIQAVVALGGGTSDKPQPFAVPAEQWPALMLALHGVLSGPAAGAKATEAPAAEALDYGRDVGPKIKLVQEKNRTALIEILTANGGVNAENGKISGTALKPESYPAVIAALDAILVG